MTGSDHAYLHAFAGGRPLRQSCCLCMCIVTDKLDYAFQRIILGFVAGF